MFDLGLSHYWNFERGIFMKKTMNLLGRCEYTFCSNTDTISDSSMSKRSTVFANFDEWRSLYDYCLHVLTIEFEIDSTTTYTLEIHLDLGW